ncbi:hypothetical protein AOLI_G00057680 [Acnodon oligacanthus]
MFNWMVKVVPHVPEGSDTVGEQKLSVVDGNGKAVGTRGKLKSAKSIKEDEQGSETSQGSVQSGVLNWLSNGFVSALPQPAGSPLLQRVNSEAKASEEEGSERPGVIGWISQGIGKVVPQPEAKYTQMSTEPDEPTEVYNMEEIPDAEPLPHIPVVEMVSEDEVSETEPQAQFQPRVVGWIKTGLQNALPYPMPRPPDYPDSSSQRSSRCSHKVLSPPPESVTSLTEVDTKVSMVGWIVHGLGLALPQPVIRSKEEHGSQNQGMQTALALGSSSKDWNWVTSRLWSALFGQCPANL